MNGKIFFDGNYPVPFAADARVSHEKGVSHRTFRDWKIIRILLYGLGSFGTVQGVLFHYDIGKDLAR
jgi:hypothetical protein